MTRRSTRAIAIRDLSLARESSDGSTLQRLYVRRTVRSYACLDCGEAFERTAPVTTSPDPGLCDPCEQRAFVRHWQGIRAIIRPRPVHPSTPEVIEL